MAKAGEDTNLGECFYGNHLFIEHLLYARNSSKSTHMC